MGKAIASGILCRDAAVHERSGSAAKHARRQGVARPGASARSSRQSRPCGDDPGREVRLVFGYSDQALTDLAKVPDDIVSPDLKQYVVTRQVKGSAGFVPGVPRLGIPDQTQTDASIGVRNSFIPSTALPSSLATAASFDPEVSAQAGR